MNPIGSLDWLIEIASYSGAYVVYWDKDAQRMVRWYPLRLEQRS